MTAYEKVEVQAYAGYSGEESPRAFRLSGKKVEVMKIMTQWIEEQVGSRERLRCFRVKGSDWRVHVLCFDVVKMEWYYKKSI
ncbi:MAG TPA: hypothetical protein VFG19_06305 [Geobacteraceae bacterium]|nr:hypothetical protein [Geobacteraceae bacterium]